MVDSNKMHLATRAVSGLAGSLNDPTILNWTDAYGRNGKGKNSYSQCKYGKCKCVDIIGLVFYKKIYLYTLRQYNTTKRVRRV